ncbi:MAG: alanine racemase [Rhodospirillaceae bacterium]|nr:alanine racemase [Rhodospirillaceae bacterium]|tara:strand:- start:54446 stop:55558 length:1113 start_codon:yes stop_codon:yes gene_type:complete
MDSAERAGAVLTVDLNVLAENYAYLKSQLADGCVCSAVVKSDAYGLGMAPVAGRLAEAGCEVFFVALLDEAIGLRSTLEERDIYPKIYVFNGISEGSENDLGRYKITPVLNSISEIERWSIFGKNSSDPCEAIINIDTGMSRLGLDSNELDFLVENPETATGIAVSHFMSHLACADERSDKMNQEQRQLFDKIRQRLPRARSSLANSAGIFLGSDFHYDLVRPGAAIYGLQPIKNESNNIGQVINLKGKIIQTRVVDTNSTVGYGATYKTARKSRLATVALGYGDGYFRTLGNSGCGYIGTTRVPIVGRISMDLVTFDITDVPDAQCGPGTYIDIIGPNNSVDDVATDAGTIGYEILTALGARYSRNYIG